MFPATGSTMMAARSGPWAWITFSTAPRSLKGAVIVSATVPSASRARRHQQRVGMPVVAALELQDLLASGEAAGQAQRAHRGLGAGGDEAHLLDARDQADHAVGQLDL